MKTALSRFKLLLVGFFCIHFAFSQEATAPAVEEKRLNHESEASVVIVGGNSASETYSAKQTTGYKWNSSLITLKGHYLMGKSKSQTTGERTVSAENWSASLRYDHTLSERFSAFLGQGASGNRFAGIDLQLDSDLGLKYDIWKSTDKDYAFSELGYRLTQNDFVEGIRPNSEVAHFARLYIEAAKSINENVFGKLWVEVLPEISDIDENWNLNFEPSLNVVLSKTFSLKTGFLGKYDAKPAAKDLEKFDYTYTLGLIAKY